MRRKERKKRISRVAVDFLDVLVEAHPRALSITEIAFGLRDRGYDITIDELKKILNEEDIPDWKEDES